MTTKSLKEQLAQERERIQRWRNRAKHAEAVFEELRFSVVEEREHQKRMHGWEEPCRTGVDEVLEAIEEKR